MTLIQGKWKIPILMLMMNGPVRLGELCRLIPHASKKVLVEQLREMEQKGIIVRTDLSGKIKHVEYTVSAPLGKAVLNLLRSLADWGAQNMQTVLAAEPAKATTLVISHGQPARSSRTD